MSIFDEYEWRGMISDATPGLDERLSTERVTAYTGFDPSASSLHVGSLLPVMALARLQRYGHQPVAIIGGGTGLIGDPSGKTQERLLLTKEKVEENLQGLRNQLERFLDFAAPENPALIVNNAEWLTTISLMDFLRDVGKHFTVNYMLAKESVSRRLEQEQGISYTEFSYMLLQAYDFYVLNERYQCTLQMGGSDQWGNILAGIELIRRLSGAKADGLVFPLVMKASGVKFGKTEAGGNIWLDEKLTSPYQFYQFWLNTEDKDVINYLKFFTWLSRDEIERQEESVRSAPEKRDAQKTLAREVTATVHGETAVARAGKASRVLFGEELSDLSAGEILDIFSEVSSTTLPRSFFEGDGTAIVNLAVQCDWNKSEDKNLGPLTKGEARRLIQGGGLYLNNQRINSDKQLVTAADLIEGKILVLRKGQKQYHLVRIEGDR
jgi:tyrosyl-tRNA synthetase